jgi:hypothetical protein
MNTTYTYLVVTIATLIFTGILLVFTADQGTHEAALIMAGLAAGHWFGYSNQLVTPAPVPVPIQEATKQQA